MLVHVNITSTQVSNEPDSGSPNTDPLESALMAIFKNHIVFCDWVSVTCTHESGQSEWSASVPEELQAELERWYEEGSMKPMSVNLIFHEVVP